MINDGIAQLRAAVQARRQAKLPVEWVDDWHVRRTTPRDDKYQGAWLVQGNHAEWYEPEHAIEEAIAKAKGFTFGQFEEQPVALGRE